MLKSKDLNLKDRRMLCNAFYCLAHNDFKAFNELSTRLQNTDAGLICKKYILTKQEDLVDKAGRLLAGKQWYVALGR